MSETPSEPQTGIKEDAGPQVGSVEANSRTPGSRSLQAGGEFLKALASDLAAVASQLRRSLAAKHRRTPTPRPSAPSGVSQRLTIGRMLWRLTVVVLALGSIGAGAICAVTLWVLLSPPLEPQRSNADPPGASFDARKGESLGRIGPLTAGDASHQGLARDAGAQGRPGSSSADAAEQMAARETRTEAAAGADQPQLRRTEPQDRRPAAGQQENSRALTDSRPRMQCDVGPCAAKYSSFRAADCTYQPHGGGPRQICEH